MAEDPASPPHVDELKDAKSGEAREKFWRAELALADKAEKEWRAAGRHVVERYRLEAGKPVSVGDGWNMRLQSAYQVLYSNTEILKAATFSQMPQPEVSRRWQDQDPLARFGSEVLERGISALVDPSHPQMGAVEAFERARDDALLPGRGMVRIRYEANFSDVPLQAAPVPTGDVDPLDGMPVTRLEYIGPEGVPVEPDRVDKQTGQAFITQKAGETVWIEHVYWEDVRFSPARCWADVWWIAYRHVMTREQLVEHFGEKGRQVRLEIKGDQWDGGADDKRLSPDPDSTQKQAVVWEIWSKRHGQVIWLPAKDDILRSEPPPIDFEGFFDCPEPLTLCHSTDTMVPVPLYSQYVSLAEELNDLTKRARKLTRSLKAAGFYDATVKHMVELADAIDGQLMPIETMGVLRDKGGLAGSITWIPIEQFAQVLLAISQRKRELIQEIYEVTGISDLVRGQTDPNETLGAQNLKAQFGNFRMNPMQKPMAMLVRNALRMMGEVVSELFDPETLAMITGMPLQAPMAPTQDPMTGAMVMQPTGSPGILDVMPLLRDEKMRGYRIDIETDQLVRPDTEAQKSEAVEFVTSVTGYLTGVLPLAMQVPPMIPLAMEMLKFQARRFKAGRSMEELIDKTADQLSGLAQQQMALQQQLQQQDTMMQQQNAEADRAQGAQQAADSNQLEREKMQQGGQQAGADRDAKVITDLMKLKAAAQKGAA